MKKIQILGTGCAKCDQLAALAVETADALKSEYTVEKVTDMMRFADFGVMITPALVVDGVVKSSGRIPSTRELQTWLR